MQQQVPTVNYQVHAEDSSNTYFSTPKNVCTIARLRKNRKIELKWGLHYQVATQYAALGRQCYPYMPTEPPASLSEEIVESEPLYVCKYCKDCFRFQNSFKDHNERRSWIFGLWCHNCFKTVCNHIPEAGTSCLTCMKEDNDKRLYLRNRGLKNYKFGVVKVFYNQCQLLEHMKMHSLCSIDMTDIMLMPLPSGLSDSDWSPELELICEALIEYAFLMHMHIMDWLKMNKIENSWWKLASNNNNKTGNLIKKITKGYRARQLFKTPEKSADDKSVDSSGNVHNVNKSPLDIELIDTGLKNIDRSGGSANVTLDKNVSENEDNPCMSTDIAFVDCGPTSKFFEPESSTSCVPKKWVSVTEAIGDANFTDPIRTNNRTNNKRKRLNAKNFTSLEKATGNTTTVKVVKKNINEIRTTKQPSKSSVRHYRIMEPFTKKIEANTINKSKTKTSAGKVIDNPVMIYNIPKNVKLYKTNSEQVLDSSMANCSSILTVQGSKDMDITSVINNLSPNLISSNKKLVFLGQDSSGLVTFCSRNETIEKRSKKLSADNGGTSVEISPQKICKSIAVRKLQEKKLTGKIVVKNGKNYLIKSVENVTKSPVVSSNMPIVTNSSRFVAIAPQREQNVSTSISIGVGEIGNVGIEQTTLHQNDVSLLTPSPSPSELSSGSSCESHVKQTLTKLRKAPSQLISLDSAQKALCETISLIKKENGDVYMSVKVDDDVVKKVTSDMYEIIPKYREEMISEFYRLNVFELKKRIDHLKHVSVEMKRAMNFISNNVLREKLRSVTSLQQILQECYRRHNQNIQDEKILDITLDEWESELKIMDPPYQCSMCKKIMKPKSYIAGFSKLPKNDNAYCTCYKHVCHKCLSYYGTSARFVAHQNFHKKLKPYVCPDCHCKFISDKYLEIHMWTVCFHMLKKHIFACKLCEIDGFRDIESITRHFVIMHSDTKVACEDCLKVFSSYSEYIKHSIDTHSFVTSTQNPIRLVICKLNGDIVRYENYMSYLENYSGIRRSLWIKCPFCRLIISESNMTPVLNSHLREKHLHSLSKVVISKEAWKEISKTDLSKTGVSDNSADIFTDPNVAACEDGTVVPKIVNTRTITSEVFERGSQDMDAWSMNFDGAISTTVADVNPQTMKNVTLPKILDVRSIADLKTESKMAKKTKSKEKRDFQTSDTGIERGRSNDLLSREGAKEAMELDDNNLNNKERTDKMKQSDKSNNESAVLADSGKSLETDDACAVESGKMTLDSESTSKTSIEGRIKVVDMRKICKPNVELFAANKLCDIQSEADNTLAIPKPPPLAKIPRYLLELATKKVARSDIGPSRSRNVARSKILARRMIGKPKRRISINEPMQDEYIEFLCHLCGERINTSSSVVRAHFTDKHSHEYQLAVMTPQLLRLSPDFIESGYKQVINKKRKSDISLFTSKRKRRWTPRKHTETSAYDNVGLCVEQESAEDGEGNFKCKRCDQRCADMSDLREHIATNHRLKDRYLICLECGENFVVAPSLQMHLKAFHGIEDPVSYMSQNPSYATDVNSNLETERRTTVANQCHVCMAVFEDKAAVDKHLRVHGMAFLNRKRIEARNALKSPEKRPNVEEDKQSPVKENPKETIKRDKPMETILVKLNAAT